MALVGARGGEPLALLRLRGLGGARLRAPAPTRPSRPASDSPFAARAGSPFAVPRRLALRAARVPPSGRRRRLRAFARRSAAPVARACRARSRRSRRSPRARAPGGPLGAPRRSPRRGRPRGASRRPSPRARDSPARRPRQPSSAASPASLATSSRSFATASWNAFRSPPASSSSCAARRSSPAASSRPSSFGRPRASWFSAQAAHGRLAERLDRVGVVPVSPLARAPCPRRSAGPPAPARPPRSVAATPDVPSASRPRLSVRSGSCPEAVTARGAGGRVGGPVRRRSPPDPAQGHESREREASASTRASPRSSVAATIELCERRPRDPGPAAHRLRAARRLRGRHGRAGVRDLPRRAGRGRDDARLGPCSTASRDGRPDGRLRRRTPSPG